jgi:hypothetical protein
VTIELETKEAIPGQPLELLVKVLVPTWFTRPVVFPSFEAPNLIVRLSSRATNPISETIERETWSGVTRRYQITPMVPGTFVIPAQELVIAWADLETNTPREDRVGVEQIKISGVLPQGAEGLDPFVAARTVTLTQEISGAGMPLQPGDSVIREVTATIEGASPMFLPPLLEVFPIKGIAIYPYEPVLSETTQNGVIIGSRVERVTYLAQSGGEGAAEPISLEWYNLKSGKVETVSVPPVPLMVDAPVVLDSPVIPVRTLLGVGIALAAMLILFLFAGRPLWDRCRVYRATREARYLGSPASARNQLRAAVRRRDLAGSLRALDLLAARLRQSDPRRDPGIAGALTVIGAARYGSGTVSEAEGWLRLDAALSAYHPDVTRNSGAACLPPLNPQ